MKKFMALALAVAMIMAVMPATLAASVAGLQKTQWTKDTATSVGQVNKNLGNLDDINKKYQSMAAPKFGTKTSWNDLQLGGFPAIDPEEANSRGYWIDSSVAGNFDIVTDYYTSGAPVYAMLFTVAEDNMAKAYSKGETVWFNYDLYSAFSDSILEDLAVYEDGYKITCMTYGGNINDKLPLIDRQIVLDEVNCGVSVKFTAPEDDFAFIFAIVIDKVAPLEDGFGAWLAISGADSDSSFKDAPKGEEMKIGEAVTTKLGSKDTKLVVAPTMSTYGMTYVQAHKITLEGGKPYVASFDSSDGIGAHIWFCDENMDVIGENIMPAFVLDYDYTYGDFAFAIWPTETSTYYMVVGGYWMTDEGDMDLTITPWDEYAGAYELIPMNETIDLADLGTTDIHIDEENPDWFYHYYSDDGIGVLVLLSMGTYTIKGDGSDVMVYANDGVKVVYDNAKTSNLRLCNSFAPVSVEAKGKATISGNEFFGYGIFNNTDATAGLYIVGDELTVDGIFGIVMENAPIHLASKKLVVDTTSMEDYYPIAIWVLGMNGQQITLGKNANLNGKNRVTEMFFDENCYFHYGYTISEYETLSRVSDMNGLDNAVLSFELTTEGLEGGSTAAGMLGDANLDGKLNTGDATTVLKYAAEMIQLSDEALANANINGDDKVNTGDATYILKVVAEIIPDPNN